MTSSPPLLQSQQAYQRGDGASAHSFSEEGKRHGAMMDTYNHQASEYIFRENNSLDRVAADDEEEREDGTKAGLDYIGPSYKALRGAFAV